MADSAADPHTIQYGTLFLQITGGLSALVTGGTGGKWLWDRWDRVRDFQKVSKLDPDFIRLYVWPLRFYGFLTIAYALSLLIAFLGGFQEYGVVSIAPPGGLLGSVLTSFFDAGLTLVFAGILLSILIIGDYFSKLVLALTQWLSYLGVLGLAGRYGPRGSSLGWIQAKEFVERQKAAKPLYISKDKVSAAADAVYKRLEAEPAAPADRAAKPNLPDPERANVLLIGCTLEKIEGELGSPFRNWAIFYRVLAESSELFTPAALESVTPNKFYEHLREVLNPKFRNIKKEDGASAPQPELAASMIAQVDVAATLNVLGTKYTWDASQLNASLRHDPKRETELLYERAIEFPKLDQQSMGPQFVKLFIRWELASDLRPSIFTQPYSERLCWLLLQFGILNVLDGIGAELHLNTDDVVRLSARCASRLVVERFRIFFEQLSDTDPVKSKFAAFVGIRREWMIDQEVDTTLWRLAKDLAKEGSENGWKDDSWKWALSRGVARRLR